MFDKILIANRGEIACRVIRTARRLGIATVAVYSDADAKALHVRMADEAVRIGPAPAAESYLRADAIVAAALQAGAQAIHPGYGFLSENAAFVAAVEAAGLVFIGPSAAAIRAMGLKDAAKRLMEEAGVPVVPGYHGTEQDPAILGAEAERIGYPVLIKARAGGGGKGMRRVDAPRDFADALESARREAEAAFGDAACLVEKYVAAPRHIEIQIFGDRHGNAVHLFERDCSLQRRHQKVIEEAPAPGMTQEMRAAMGEAAVRAAKAIGYAGAGTIEFIVDGSGGLSPDGFWFMEMNTRLQVEHPVTEAITGLDLVALQLQVAAGEPLPFTQESLAIDGHAFEARLYAEDPAKGFLPATGRLTHLCLPDDARIDTGVEEGDAVSPFYDPMIAKIITHGPDRASALRKLHDALKRVEVAGLVTNAAFLARLAAHEGFARGEVDTGLIERDLASLLPPKEKPAVAWALVAAFEAGAFKPAVSVDPWDALRGFRAYGNGRTAILFDDEGAALTVTVEERDGRMACETPAGRVELIVERAGERPRLRIDGRRVEPAIARRPGHLTLFLDGDTHDFRLHAPGAAGEAQGAGSLVSPMPGTVRLVAVSPGDEVSAGQTLVVVDAMKMEHAIKAPRDGIVAELLVAAGQAVEDGTMLLRLEEDG
ncbi:acetyl/propionyl/methylcrotonyl-CoA carboxylase subunit alpha [Aureimonas mangrovi]|uniref:acetyl/propionyl/methylcrotonyl-CoA carboxylase subunit alpha n=1 Tax=Aureimonas mangrovi TaxID=2758041 RepID=UPI00163D4B28|nr:acetyl/propionyl/methylcrotonyl-CoA carboxylase subunit alpha [Aureimonas mangrovi]